MDGDAFGYSPDIGNFVTRDGKTYTEHGYVYARGSVFRTMPTGTHHENYADWTDEQRAAKVAEYVQRREDRERERKLAREARRSLVAQAKTKLTEEEFEAVLGYEEEE